MSLKNAIAKIASGVFLGFVECDISVPDSCLTKFSEMAPILQNTDVGREHFSEHMKRFAINGDFLKQPQRMLIGSLFGKKILLLSELAKWYLSHGLVITRVYQMIEHTPRAVYKEFGESVSDARRKGDVDPSMTLLASTSKLIGNSAYGKTITNKEKHKNVKYVDGSDVASTKIKSKRFCSLSEID